MTQVTSGGQRARRVQILYVKKSLNGLERSSVVATVLTHPVPDVQTLFAESLMNINAWKLWTADGKPNTATEEIGAKLMSVKRYAGAEAVYREDLRHNPDNGWALFGLSQALHAQGKTAAGVQTDSRFEEAWQYADVTLTSSSSN